MKIPFLQNDCPLRERLAIKEDYLSAHDGYKHHLEIRRPSPSNDRMVPASLMT